MDIDRPIAFAFWAWALTQLGNVLVNLAFCKVAGKLRESGAVFALGITVSEFTTRYAAEENCGVAV